MIEISLSSGDIALVTPADYGLVTSHRWSPRRCPHTTYAQANIKINGKWTTVSMHRLITGAGPGQTVDHENHNGLDNQRTNLRISGTRHGNNRNAQLRKDNTSGYKGVSYYRAGNSWSSGIYIEGRRQHLGRFSTAELAARAYNIAAAVVFGEYAQLNDIIADGTVDETIRDALREHGGQLGGFIRDPDYVRKMFGGIE